MNCFYIIVNTKKENSLELGKFIKQYLEKTGKICYIHENENLPANKKYKYTNVEQIPEEVEVVLVVGGDGTLIQAARDLANRDLPLVGVNLGRVGYLCELEEANMLSALECMIQDQYLIEERMMLNGIGYRAEKEVVQNDALNDIVIHRIGPLRIMNFIIYVNGEHLNTYSADGIIIATPTGSTAYSMSAGGPIVEPSAKILVITPINPHALNRKSIILSADDKVVVEIGSGRKEEMEEAEVTFDGADSVKLFSGDYIEIKQSPRCVKILKTSKISFLETLRKKMQECT